MRHFHYQCELTNLMFSQGVELSIHKARQTRAQKHSLCNAEKHCGRTPVTFLPCIKNHSTKPNVLQPRKILIVTIKVKITESYIKTYCTTMGDFRGKVKHDVLKHFFRRNKIVILCKKWGIIHGPHLEKIFKFYFLSF